MTAASRQSADQIRTTRVVMFDPGYFLPWYIDQLCDSLSALGLQIQVVASPPLFESVSAVGPHRIDRLFFRFLRGRRLRLLRHRRHARQVLKALTYPFGIARTWWALRRGPRGVFHVQWAPIPALDALLIRVLKAAGWRVVYTVHDPLPERMRGRRRLALLKLADAVIVHAPHQIRELVDAVPELSPRLHLIPHGATVFPMPSEQEKRSCRVRLGIDVDRPLILFFGMIKPYKGLDYLIAAMPDVVARVPRALLVVAGEPFISLRRLRKQIDSAGLTGHVALRPGFQPDEEVPRYMRAADILVAPYVNIGVSGVVVLAQSHGVPVIVSRVGGLPDFADNGACGLVVPPRAPAALAEAIVNGLMDRSTLDEMGRRGRAMLSRENRWSDVGRTTADLYRRLVHETAPARVPAFGRSERPV